MSGELRSAAVRLASRFRPSGSAVALLAAVLLAVLMVDCSMAHDDTHNHMPRYPAVEHLAVSVADGPLPAAIRSASDDHCPSHFDHCLAKTVLRGVTGNPGPQLLIFALALAVLPSALRAFAGVRGPPISRPPASDGRTTLTRFCIARC
ncbi:hypothetical protein [Nocardia sp. CNY236]|uniref:hypothetical protein n=1 Tax=Nocardia sp. CNY236 TaxID=1169152 RepID=UPI001E31E837|nr:hypothetical protein [Nocardia sp. CNY236]